mmetsp:Transcript_1395/g.4560  ORF Transcript_1395/g.4560 Transcript_1395/m.4560 type:complete len:90 (-) Transcript_1395:557-826(-)
MGKGKGQKVMEFDLATAMTKKETRKLTKMECMVNYHLARVPFWNGKESVAMANAEKCAAHPQSRCVCPVPGAGRARELMPAPPLPGPAR